MNYIKLLGALLCFCMSSVINAQEAAFKELVSLFDTYIERVSSAPTEAEYKEAASEFLEKLDEMGKKYPNYEPTEEQSKTIEKKFNEYQEERNTTRERLDIDEDEEYESDPPDLDLGELIKGMVTEEEVDSIINSYNDITNDSDKLIKILNDFSDQFEASSDFVEILILSQRIESVMNKLEDEIDESDLEDAIEDENSPLNAAMQRLEKEMGEAVSRSMQDINTEEIDGAIEDDVEVDELSDEDQDYLDAVHELE